MNSTLRKNSTVPPTSIYISNLSEDVWPFICALPESERIQEISENALLSDRELISCLATATQVAILPHLVGSQFVDYLHQTLGVSPIQVLVPRHHSGQTCLDILADQTIMAFLKNLSVIELTSYTASPQFYQLVDELQKLGIKVTTPEAPALENAGVINQYGSKTGLRKIITTTFNSDQIRMADGVICGDIDQAVSQASRFYEKNQGVVMKTDKGHAGAGVLIFRPGDLPDDPSQCQDEIRRHLDSVPYWSQFPIVIEDLLDLDLTIGGGNPSVEVQIDSSGQANLLYLCGMRVTTAGVFKGIEINRQIFAPELTQQIENIGRLLGEKYADSGYRGYFDVDLAIDKHHRLYLTESNVRRTGGTHVYLVAKHLFGPDFDRHVYTLSQNLHPLVAGKKLTFDQLVQTLKPILLMPGKSEGVLLAATNLLERDKIAYVIFGRNQARALALEAQMEQLLA